MDPMCRPPLWGLIVMALSALTPAACRPLVVVPSAQPGEVAVTPSPAGEVVNVTVGQTVLVRRPADFSEWQVDYSTAVVRALTPPDRMRTPDADGWKLKAIASGETDVTVTPAMKTGVNNRAAPPAPPQFKVTIRVQ
jgi:hypothetical protein